MFRAAPKLEIAFLSSSLISDRRDASPVKKRKKRKKKKKKKKKKKREILQISFSSRNEYHDIATSRINFVARRRESEKY